MNRLTLFAGGLAAALALLLGGCGSSGPNLNGPFGDSAKGPIGAQCFQSEPKGSVATLGMLSFSNKGGPARIDKVTLVDARDLQTVAEWLVPITGHDLMGVLDGYPPYGSKRGSQGPAPGIHWASRQRAVGATIAHMPFPLSINLIVVLRPTGSLGTVKTVYLDYESGGTKYRLNFQVAIELYNGSHKPCRLTVN